MSMDCYCDYEPADVYRARIAKARLEYICDECGGPIASGARYENVFMAYDGSGSTFRTCERCRDLRVWVKNNVPCLCVLHGDMDNQMQIAIDDAVARAPDETVGLRFGFLRRKDARDRAIRKPTRL